MKVRTLAAPRGGFSLIAGSILLSGAYFYMFLGAAPVTGVEFLYKTFGLGGLISLDGFFTLGHMTVYAVLTVGLCRVFKSAESRPAIAATLAGLGVLIEILQGEFFSRQFQLTDMAANVTGITIGLIVTAIAARRGGRRVRTS
jgi:hypothetical protein